MFAGAPQAVVNVLKAAPMIATVSAIPDGVDALKATLIAERAAHAAELERLHEIIKAFQRV